MKAVPYILGISQGVVKEMAGYSHTPASCLSKPRSRQEAGKKQLRVWLRYVCGVTEMFLDEPSGRAERLYPSFGVGFKPTFLTLGRANAFVLHSFNRKVPLLLLLSPYGDSEMANNGFEDGSMRCVTGKIGGMVIEADLLPHEPMFVE